MPIEVDEADVEAERLQQNVRQLMRNVPSSVVIVTVASYDSEMGTNVPMGVAVSSLSTVTLDPPLISFNIKQPSKTLDAIRAAEGRFRVHFPAGNRGGASTVDLFSHGNHPDAYNMRIKKLKLLVPGITAATKYLETKSKAPQIASDSVRAAMECTLTQEVPVADHVILVAKVDSIENRAPGNRTILYVDGSYIRADGTLITVPNDQASAMQSTRSVWDHRLFPGEEERRNYVELIKPLIKAKPSLLESGKDAIRNLEAGLPMSPGLWGINLEQLIDECRREAGMASNLSVSLQESSVLSDFYGRLTPSDRSKIVERAKNLVATNSDYLHQNFRIFLQHLGVSTASIDLLPSDIAGPLRAHGLLVPFIPRMQHTSLNRRDYNLQYLEQVEVSLVGHLAALGHEKAIVTQLAQAMEDIGEHRQLATYFKKCRARLYAAAFPKLFGPSRIDIAGEVSQEETRVIISRVVRYMQVDDHPSTFRKRIHNDFHETLRMQGIHPCITGFDAEFFFGKLQHIYTTSHTVGDMASRVEEMVRPWFDTAIGWEDFETRVKSFVQKEPMRAMSWSTRDKLAAMGLSWEAVLDVPSSMDKQPLNGGQVLNTIVAKELKALHGEGPEELSQAIAQYLKQEYNFDVDPDAPTIAPLKVSRVKIKEVVGRNKRPVRFQKMLDKKAAAKESYWKSKESAKEGE
jgi:flavin reductase (DIM6/NTAB) family NADH-FMN oxidoreductase RutF